MKPVKQNILVEQEPFNSIIPVLLLLGLLVIVIGFLLTTTITTHYKNTRLKDYALRLTDKINQLRTEQTGLQKEITALNNDPFYLEFLVRKDLGMCQQGEILIQQD